MTAEDKACTLIDKVFGYANDEASTSENYDSQISKAAKVALVTVDEIQDLTMSDEEMQFWADVRTRLNYKIKS